MRNRIIVHATCEYLRNPTENQGIWIEGETHKLSVQQNPETVKYHKTQNMSFIGKTTEASRICAGNPAECQGRMGIWKEPIDISAHQQINTARKKRTCSVSTNLEQKSLLGEKEKDVFASVSGRAHRAHF